MKTKTLPIFRLAMLFSALLPSAFALEIKETEEALTVLDGENEVLVYHKAEVAPPEGVDAIFKRSGFIHPLKTPKGGMLTGSRAKDHWHHMGLWNAWVHTEFDGAAPDFWNLGDGSGLVRFTGVGEVTKEGEKVGFEVKQQEVAVDAEKKETPVLDETLAMSFSKGEEVYVIDYVLTQKNIAEMPLELPAYRYGGPLAWRGPLDWNKKNSDYLTSEGKTRKNSHESRANWVLVHGPTEAGEGSLVMMGSPENHDSPQRLRTWDDGKMFLCWTPIQEKGMTIKPGEEVVWKFRLLAADGVMTAEEIGKKWASYGGNSK